MPDHEPDKLADQLERELDRMQEHNEQLGEEVAGVRDEWQRKRADEGVPGAPAPEGDAQREPGDPTSAQDPPPEVGPPGQ